MNIKKLFLMLATVLASAAPAVAQQTASLWWGYGDGESIWKNVGGGTNATTQTAAIKVPADVVASYVGARIKAIKFATSSNTANVTDVSYFLTSNLDSLKDEECTPVGMLYNGWHTFELTTPYQIQANRDLFIGYKATGVRPVALVDQPGCEGSCWMKSGKKFYDYGVMEGYNYTLGVQALIEADNFEASITFDHVGNAKAEPTGGALPISVRSMSPVEVTSYTLAYSVDGQQLGTKTTECSLAEIGDIHSTQLPLPDLALGQHTYEAEIVGVNGKAYDKGIKIAGNIEVLKYVMYRTHVIEEKTGTWCGYCVSGLVAMREMRKNHPKRYIGIAVHGEDKYQTSSYATLLTRGGGYPSAFINRSQTIGTTPSEMENAFQKAPELAECEVKILGIEYADQSHSRVNIHMRYRVAQDHHRIDYRLAVVTIEDYLSDSQANFYSGGGRGPMGGFESLGSWVWVQLMDVARDITNYTGIVNSIPAELEEGRWYDYVYTYTLPYSIKDRNNISIAVLMQNATGTEILNADKCEVIHEQGEVGIQAITINPHHLTTSQPHDLMGRPIPNGKDANGLQIQDGQLRFIVR